MNFDDEKLSTKWAGALLAVGSVVMPVAIILYIFAYGQPIGTGENGMVTVADTARHISKKWEIAANVWRVEVFATVLIAVASFILMNRRPPESKRISSKAGWAFVAVGSVLLVVMYAFMLGAYPSAAAAFQTEPALLPAMHETAVFLFNLGNFTSFLGFCGVFLTELSARTIPKWLAVSGAGLSVFGAIVTLAFLYNLSNFKQFLLFGPVVMIWYLIAAFYGFSLWKKN